MGEALTVVGEGDQPGVDKAQSLADGPSWAQAALILPFDLGGIPQLNERRLTMAASSLLLMEMDSASGATAALNCSSMLRMPTCFMPGKRKLGRAEPGGPTSVDAGVPAFD